MQKAAKHFSAITGRLLFIGFTMQILLGLVWMCCNIGRLEEPGLSVQLVLLPVAFGAGLFLVKTITETKKIVWMVWGSLALLTVPMSLHCHLMNPKESVIGSFLVFQISFLWRAIKKKEAGSLRALAAVLVFWILEAVVDLEYLLLGALPVILLLFCGWRERKKEASGDKKVLCRLLVICILCGIFLGSNIYEVSADLFGRCTWTTFIRDWNYWTDEMYEAAGSQDILFSAAHNADNVNELLKPAVLENLGKKQATEFYFRHSIDAVKEFPVQILRECLWDTLAYSMPPVGTYLFLEGEGYDSYCPMNYDLMRRQTPRLTGYYMDYSCKWFMVAMMLAAGNMVLGRMSKTTGQKDVAKRSVIGICGVIVLHHTLQGAGIMDYRKAIVICSLWVVWMINAIIKMPEMTEQEIKEVVL